MKMKLKTITPVHISTGLKYGPNEYLIERGKIKRIKINAFLEILDKRQIKELCKEMDKFHDRFQLSNFLHNQNIDKSKLNIFYEMQDFADIFKHKNEIREQIKTNNIPYIPGTSIKGAIRTALLWRYLKEKNFKLKICIQNENETKIETVDLFELMKNNEIAKNLKIAKLNPLFSEKEDNQNKFFANRFIKLVFDTSYFEYNKKYNNYSNKFDAKYDLLKFLEVSDFMPDEQNKNMKIDKIETYALAKKKVKFRKGVIKKFESIGFKQYIETLNGNFTGTIKLSPQLKIALKNKNEYPLLKEKLNILGLDENLKEYDFIAHLKNVMQKFNDWCLEKEIDLCKEANANDKVDYLNQIKDDNKNNNLIRIGFGIGTTYQTLIKLIKEEDPDLYKKIRKNCDLGKNFKRNNDIKLSNPYPKSIEFTAKNESLGWLEWQ